MPGLKKDVTYTFAKISRLERSSDESFASDDSDRIEEPFADSLRSFSSRINSSTVGVALYDQGLECKAVNVALTRMNEVLANTHFGKTIYQIFRESAPELEVIFQRVWESGNSFSNFPLTAQFPAGTKSPRWLVSLFPIKDKSGKVRLIAATFSEVTKRSSVELHLSRLRNKFHTDASGNSKLLGEEFTQRSVRTLDLVRHSVDLLKRSMSLRCRVFEARIGKGFMDQPLSLGGTRPRTSLFRPALRRRGSEVAPFARPSATNQGEPPANSPSPRERQILHLLADGKSNKEIGALLEISTRTVEFYRARVMLKLDLHSTAALVRYAIRNNIVEA